MKQNRVVSFSRLLTALLIALLSAVPARADVAPQTFVMDQPLIRKDVGPTQVDIVSEDVQVFLNKTNSCIIKTKYVLRNPGKSAVTRVAVPGSGRHLSTDKDHYFIVKMNGKIKKVDSYDPNRPLEMNEYDRYLTARWAGWPLRFNPGETLTLEVTTKSGHRATFHDYIRPAIVPAEYEVKEEWTDEAEKQSVEKPLDEMNFAFTRELWRSDTHPRKLTLFLQNGLTQDNIIEMRPSPQVVNKTTFVWNFNPKQDYDKRRFGPFGPMDVAVKYMPSCTNTQLLAIYQKLAAKHPRNATIIARMGQVFASQGRYDKQLALYRQFLMTQKPNTKTTAQYAIDSMRKAWATFCDSTGNQKQAKKMISIFNKLIDPPKSFYYNDDELNTYKKWVKKYS